MILTIIASVGLFSSIIGIVYLCFRYPKDIDGTLMSILGLTMFASICMIIGYLLNNLEQYLR